VRQRVDEMFGWSGVLIPKGTDALQMMLNTAAVATSRSSTWGTAST
jgi:hypothetical protein